MAAHAEDDRQQDFSDFKLLLWASMADELGLLPKEYKARLYNAASEGQFERWQIQLPRNMRDWPCLDDISTYRHLVYLGLYSSANKKCRELCQIFMDRARFPIA